MAGLRRISRREIGIRSDFDEKIPLLDPLSFFHRQGDDFPGYFRADQDLAYRINLSIGDDRLGDVAQSRLLDLYGNHVVALPGNGDPDSDARDDQQADYNNPKTTAALFRLGHG